MKIQKTKIDDQENSSELEVGDEDDNFSVPYIWDDLAREIAKQKGIQEPEYNNPLFPENQSQDYFYSDVGDCITTEVVISMDVTDEIETPNLDTPGIEYPGDISEETDIKFEEIIENKHIISDDEIQTSSLIFPEQISPPATEEKKEAVQTRGKRRNTRLSKKETNNQITFDEIENLETTEDNNAVRTRSKRKGEKLSEKPENCIAFDEKENPPARKRRKRIVKTPNKRKGIRLSEKTVNSQITFDSSNVQYTCEKCRTTFKTKSLLSHHIKTAHSKDNKFCCKFCAMQTTTTYNYRRHLIRFHSQEKDPEVQILIKSFFSSKKNKVFPTAKSYAAYPCGKCTKTFSSENTRRLHTERLHSDKRKNNISTDSVRKRTRTIRSRP